MQPHDTVEQQQKQMLTLLGKYDIDPGRYRPLYYGVPITVGVAEGAIGRGSITINNQPYVMTHVMTHVVGNVNDYATTGLANDGQWLIDFKDEQSNYQNVPMPAAMLFGGCNQGYVLPLAYPIAFAGNKTLNFNLTNLYARTLDPQRTDFVIYVAIAGVADWGDLAPRR